MRNFSFSSQEEEQEDIERIIRWRRRKIAKQQLIYAILLVCILLMLVLWVLRKIKYTDFDGYISVDNNVVRMGEDIYVLETFVRVGDFIVPGDTLFSYVYTHPFYGHETVDSEPTVIVHARDYQVQYGLARQELDVLRVRIEELTKQLEIEDHNIRFGLSDNHNKMKTEQELAEAKEQYKALRRKLGVLWNALSQTNQAVSKMYNGNRGYLYVQDMRNIQLMRELGFIRYSIAVDTALISRVDAPELALVLRGEPIITSQSTNLVHNNLAVMAYVMPEEMKRITRNTHAEVIVNDQVRFTARVLKLGARIEEIPGELRSSLSRDHMAVIAVFEVDSNQVVPFWSLIDNLPVQIRIDNFRHEEKLRPDYLMYNTTSGIIRETVDMERTSDYYRGNNETYTANTSRSNSAADTPQDQPAATPDPDRALVDSLTTDSIVADTLRHDSTLAEAVSALQTMGDTLAPAAAEADTATPAAPTTPAPVAVAPAAEEEAKPVAKNYHIIVGSTPDMEAAQWNVRKLRRKGYDEARVITTGTMHRVVMASYPSMDEANAALRDVRKIREYRDAWVRKIVETKERRK